jgi:hypothetical protein
VDGVVHPNVEQAIGRDRIRKALKRYENRPADEHRYGIVRAVNEDGSYEVLLDGDVQTSRCAQYGTALVGDRVLAVTKKDGRNDLLGRLGGDPFADYVVAHGVSGNWQYVKYASGLAELWIRHEFTSAINTPFMENGAYKSATQTIALPFALKSTNSPVISAISGGTWSAISTYAYLSDVSNVKIYALSDISIAAEKEIVASAYISGRWK